MSNGDIVQAVLQQAGISLFEAYELKPTQVGRPERAEPRIKLASIVGFTGRQMRGVLLLALTEDALGSSPTLREGKPADWLAELSNQLLGRVKNSLLAHGADIDLATPLVIRGERLAPSMEGDETPTVFSFPQGAAYAWFDWEAIDEFQLSEDRSVGAAMPEGDALLF